MSYYYKLKYKIYGGFQLVIGVALFHHPFSFGIVHERFTIQPFGATPMTEETSWVDRELITANDEWLPRSSQMFPCLMTPDFSNTYSIHIWWFYGGFLSHRDPHLNHPFLDGIFPNKNQLAIGVPPWPWKPTYVIIPCLMTPEDTLQVVILRIHFLCKIWVFPNHHGLFTAVSTIFGHIKRKKNCDDLSYLIWSYPAANYLCFWKMSQFIDSPP